MVFLFRRFRKEKKAAAPSAETDDSKEDRTDATPSEAASGEPGPSQGTPPGADLAAAPIGPGPPEPTPSPSRPPPPLPTVPPAIPVPAGEPSAVCFLCGTALENRRCPQCDMVWVE